MYQRPRSAALPSADRDDIGLGIQAHALNAAMMPAMIRAEGVQHDRMIERAVAPNRIGAQLALLAFARLAVSDVERLLIR